ncbi:hypothetical protein [Pelistega sp. MC2]|uniref:hypothetical protein n=1 Tax=Pelistega sp. MC2 TaxID=1720297 RepID=UPI0008DB1F94|nr:hypothetical protein [Pelistega sp. MC2]
MTKQLYYFHERLPPADVFFRAWTADETQTGLYCRNQSDNYTSADKLVTIPGSLFTRIFYFWELS